MADVRPHLSFQVGMCSCLPPASARKLYTATHNSPRQGAALSSDCLCQVGATPEFIEKPRCLADHSILEVAAAELGPEDQPVAPTQADAKWRFFWRVGPRPQQTQYAGALTLLGVGGWVAPAAARVAALSAQAGERGQALARSRGSSKHSMPRSDVRESLDPTSNSPVGNTPTRQPRCAAQLASPTPHTLTVCDFTLPSPLPSCGAELNAEPVVPAAFPEWAEVMDGWGSKLLGAVSVAAEMLARGFGMDPHAFTRRMELGPHLLAPTGAGARAARQGDEYCLWCHGCDLLWYLGAGECLGAWASCCIWHNVFVPRRGLAMWVVKHSKRNGNLIQLLSSSPLNSPPDPQPATHYPPLQALTWARTAGWGQCLLGITTTSTS